MGGSLWLNSLPNDKILGLSKLKAIADDQLKVIPMAKFVLDKIENIDIDINLHKYKQLY